MKIKEKLVDYLKEQWLSNYQMQYLCKSSSADRVARHIRQNPPENYHMEQRRKDCETYCLEFKLVKDVW